MADNGTVRTFLLEAIKGLSKENFDELVRIFQVSYWKCEDIVNVDGANDGGTDIKIFRDKKELKKCIQITVQKQGLGLKLNADLKKVSEKISKYGYSNIFEFYCSSSVSEDFIEEVKKNALQEHSIVLEIYDAKRLSQLNCKEVVDYIYSLHSGVILKPEQMNIDKATKTLYDILANGKYSSDIKNSLVDSIIISIIYEKGSIEISELKKELENRLGKEVPDILHSINTLKSVQRIIKDSNNSKYLRLSESEYNNVKEILANSVKLEKEFCNAFTAILSKYGIEYSQEILDELKNLYKRFYNKDIDDSIQEESTELKVFDSFKKYLMSLIDDKNNTGSLIDEIKELCSTNSYLNRISASESFLSLYKSNQLELYLNQKHKDVYLDTPTFIYLLCDYYGIEENDWDNPFYRSMKSLMNLRDSYSDKISFYITESYLGEVIGEIKKALQFAQFEDYPLFKYMGGTNNTLFNYYEYLKKGKLFDDEDDVNSFGEFINSYGLENTDPNSAKFSREASKFLYEIAENLDIQIVAWSPNEKFADFKILYENILLKKEKNKSETAIRNDVNQVLVSLEHDKEMDCYFATWDTTIHLLRDEILSENHYNYFNICNPAKLSNKIALENFNIDGSALTNDIFAYAEKEYDISNRVKSLLELIAPFFKGTGSKKLFRKLGKIRKEQVEIIGSDIGSEKEEKNLPIEEIVWLLIPKEKDDKNIMDKFSKFMSSEENADYIIDVINQISKLEDYKKYDLTEFFEKIESIDLSTQDENL